MWLEKLSPVRFSHWEDNNTIYKGGRVKILGLGLSKTGTSSLAKALSILGYRTLHWAPERWTDIILGSNSNPSFRRFDDIDAVTDIPAAYFYHELLETYPHCKCILTVRDADAWFQSVARHYKYYARRNDEDLRLQEIVYGSQNVSEFIYKKKMRDHNQAVQYAISSDQLLIFNITEGQGWQQLCKFLNVKPPSVDFPHLNASAISKN